MACSPTDAATELDFVKALHTRTRDHGQCRGPLLTLFLWSWQLETLEHIFDSEPACDVLWGGFQPSLTTSGFQLCAAHWFDLACLTWARALQHSRPDWSAQAEVLLKDLCDVAGWDAKEIVNMFAWQRARLT